MDPSDGLTVEDVLYEVGVAFMATQHEPERRLAQIDTLVSGQSTFTTANHLRAVVEGAQTGAIEAAGGPPTDAELQDLIVDTMVFNSKPGVYHASSREFSDFLTKDGPRTLRLREEFDSRPHETFGDFQSRHGIV
jgi:hypothetical protein